MRSVVVGTAGHIDHGKSALVRALTGTDPDRLKEEKARGITIDLGFAHLLTGGVNLAFVDVPGHERFVRNMLAGAAGIDLVLLVIAADEGVMPQTREHFEICRLLRVHAGVVALTKTDLVDTEGLELARLDARELLAGSFLKAAPIVPVSARTGEGLDALRSALLARASQVAARSADGVARLPIDRIFSMKGFGTVVTGTLVSGRIQRDTQLQLEPGGRLVSVRGVQVHGAQRSDAIAGERVAANLAGLDVDEAERGQALITPHSLAATQVVDASLELLPSVKPLRHGARVRFHQGTAEVLGRVAVIGPASTEQAAPSIAPGSRAFVRLRLERPALLTRRDRYIVRAYSPTVTIGGGEILDPEPPRAGVRSQAALDRASRLDSLDDESFVELLVTEAGLSGLALPALISRAGLTAAAAEGVATRLAQSGRAIRAGDVLAAPSAVAAAKGSVMSAIEQHHRDQPRSEGISREELRTRLFARSAAVVFDRVIDELVRDETIAGRERLHLAARQAVLSPADQRAAESIERTLLDAGLRPPDQNALAAAAGISLATLQQLLQVLQRQHRVVKIDTLLFHEHALVELKQAISAMKSEGHGNATIDVATFKERFGITRKFAIPLQYLDRERVTRRTGEKRTIL